MKRFYHIFLLLAFIVTASHSMGQTLSVASIQPSAGEPMALAVSTSQLSEFTTLQFSLQLPAGMKVDEKQCKVGEAAAAHTLSISPLANGNTLFVLYSLDLQQFANGTLLTIPLAVNNDAVSGEALLYTVRSATSDAVSSMLADVPFVVSTSAATAIRPDITDSKKPGLVYNLGGQQLSQPQRGVNIVDGRKVVR